MPPEWLLKCFGRRVTPGDERGLLWKQYMLAGEFGRAWELSDLVPGSVKSLAELSGKRVLVRCEHGLGDSIQFLRYIDLLRPIAGRILVHVQPRLLPLVRLLPGVDEAFTWGDEWPSGKYDCEIEVMDLPHAFRTMLSTIPARVPYLQVEEDLVRIYREKFDANGKRNVGLVASSGAWDARRTVPAAYFAGLENVPGIVIRDLPGEAETSDVRAVAAAIQNLDLLIAVDTMAAHLAGALARPVWLLLPFAADWRWMNREESPWYPTMRIFRQQEDGEWEPVVRRVISELAVWAHRRAAV